jgi:hypothetical protein
MVFVERVRWASRCKDAGSPASGAGGTPEDAAARRSSAAARLNHYFAKPSYGPRSALPRARKVTGPKIPSAVRPAERWNRVTAFFVTGPYTPSTFPAEKPRLASARWRTATCVPVAPGLSVVAGAGSFGACGVVVAAVVTCVVVVGEDVGAGGPALPPLKTPPAASPTRSSTINATTTTTTRRSIVGARDDRRSGRAASLSQSSARGATFSSD